MYLAMITSMLDLYILCIIYYRVVLHDGDSDVPGNDYINANFITQVNVFFDKM